ncbi:glycosyltransferase family 2 protein [Alsobacter sp. R-9]
MQPVIPPERPDSSPADPRGPELSVVIPVFNEGANIDLLAARVQPILERVAESFEVVFVDDGSRDDTLARIRALHGGDPRWRAVSFSRNFGKEIAIAAGLDHARGRAVVIMDADLQHPPEMIETFMRHWREGYLMVYGQRTDREADGPLRRGFTRVFYRLFQAFGETPLPEGAGDFRLLDRKAVDALRQMGERARFSKGLYAWIGFRQIGVPFDVAERAHGSSKFNARKLFRFAFDGITSFSTVPLRLWTYIGVSVSALAFVTAVYFVAETMIRGVDVPGFASLIVSVMFFAGVQLISLGVIGEYIGRIFAEVKRRPLYIVGDSVGFDAADVDAARPLGPERRRA